MNLVLITLILFVIFKEAFSAERFLRAQKTHHLENYDQNLFEACLDFISRLKYQFSSNWNSAENDNQIQTVLSNCLNILKMYEFKRKNKSFFTERVVRISEEMRETFQRKMEESKMNSNKNSLNQHLLKYTKLPFRWG